MKILIIYASAGQGHRRAAEAIYEYLKENSSHQVSLIDSLEYTNQLFKIFYTNGYEFLIKHFPGIWGFFYRQTDNPKNKWLNCAFRAFYGNLNSFRLRNYLQKENPDLIISTHFFANDFISELKKNKLIKSRLFCVITDYLAHYFWKVDCVDKYLVACQITKDQLINFGISQEKILITGIPVNKEFYQPLNKNKARLKLNLNLDKFSILIMTGAFGFGSIEKIVMLLKNEAQLLVICGNNKKLLQKLNSLNDENLKIFGFVKNVHELMSASDLIITKPGGLTISEALVKNLPMIFISPIPGQETNNAQLFQRLKLALSLKNTAKIVEVVRKLKNNPDYLLGFKSRICEFSGQNSLGSILKAI